MQCSGTAKVPTACYGDEEKPDGLEEVSKNHVDLLPCKVPGLAPSVLVLFSWHTFEEPWRAWNRGI